MLPLASESEEITAAQLHALRMQQTELYLIDCREIDEWDFNHIDGGMHAALSEFPRHLPRLLRYNDRPMIVYCHHGIRSLHATRWLREQGLTDVFSLSGGIERWSREIDDTVPLY